MKKEYQKPYLAVESFQLNAAIAASCTSEGKFPINHGQHDCTLGDNPGEEPDVIFGAACVVDVYTQSGDGNDGFCYHGPVADMSLVFVYS